MLVGLSARQILCRGCAVEALLEVVSKSASSSYLRFCSLAALSFPRISGANPSLFRFARKQNRRRVTRTRVVRLLLVAVDHPLAFAFSA